MTVKKTASSVVVRSLKVRIHDERSSEVHTSCFPETILKHCQKRSDDWAYSVQGRIECFGKDLHAFDCIYHNLCSTYFRNGQDMPEKFRSEPRRKPKQVGRPTNEDQRQAFLRVCDYLEDNDEEQITISELVRKMGEYLLEEGSIPYGSHYLKQKLKEHYGASLYTV